MIKCLPFGSSSKKHLQCILLYEEVVIRDTSKNDNCLFFILINSIDSNIDAPSLDQMNIHLINFILINCISKIQLYQRSLQLYQLLHLHLAFS